MKLTKRDVLFFILGIIGFFIVEITVNWNTNVESFKRGWAEGSRAARTR